MQKQMEEVGGSLDDVVSMTVHITDVRYNGELVELQKEFFQEDHYPASTLVTVKALNRTDALIEITATAVMVYGRRTLGLSSPVASATCFRIRRSGWTATAISVAFA